MNNIIQGDNGSLFILTIKDVDQIIDITGTTVEVTIKFRQYGVIKQATITDGVNGKCQFTLSSEDIQNEGNYTFQATVTFTNGNKFSSEIYRFTVDKKLGFIPSPPSNGGGSSSTVSDSSINGNILVNNLELKVYDDADIQIKVSQLQALDIIKRLGISVSGKLTIDGVEQIGGGSEDMTLVIKDYFSGSSNITKNYTDSMIGFEIANDGTSDLTFTINGLTIPVKGEESYSANFDPYKQVTINTTVPYRATVSALLNGTVSPSQPDTTAPNNVTGLTVSNITTTGLTLSWTASNSSDTSGYDIYQGSTKLLTVTGNTYNATGLTANTSYTFTVKAKDNSGNIASGVSVTSSTLALDTTPPVEVTNLQTSNVTSSTLTLTWSASTSSDIASYDVYQGSTLLGNVTGNTYNVSSLSASTQYTFKIKSKDTSNNVSTGVSITTTTTNVADTTAPNNITNLQTSNLSTTSVTLTWTASTSTDTVGYDIYNASTLVTTTSNTSYTVTSLTAGTQYTFTVKAKDGANNIASGVSSTVTTVALDTTAPVITVNPNGGTFTSSQNVTLSTNETATIYYTLDGSTPTTSSTVYSSPIAVNATSTLQYFARDTAGNSSSVQSAVFSINIPDTTAPNNVTNLATSNVTSNGLKLSWDASTSPDTTGYDIYNGSTFITTVTGINYTVTGLAGSTTYTFWVKAKDNSGNIASGTSVGVTTSAALPVTVVNDDFNRADGAIGFALTGQAWSTNSMTIINNQAGHLAGSSFLVNPLVMATGKKEQIEVSADVIFSTSLVTGNVAGLVLNYIDPDNCIFWGFGGDGVRLTSYTFGSTGAGIPVVDFYTSVNTSYRLKATIETGGIYKFYVDDVLQTTWTYTGYTGIKHGLISYNSTNPRFDNFTVKTLV